MSNYRKELRVQSLHEKRENEAETERKGERQRDSEKRVISVAEIAGSDIIGN